MLIKNERCKYAAINPKAQAIFVHVIVNGYLPIYVTSKKHKEFF